MEKIVISEIRQLAPLSSKSLKRRGRGMEGYSEGTLEQAQVLSKVFNQWNQGQEVTLDRAKEFLRARLDSHSFATVRREKTLLKRLILDNFPAMDSFLAEKRISLEFSELRTPETEKNKTLFTIGDTELREVLEHYPNRQRLFIRFLYATACRVSEMLSIKLANCKTSGSETFISIVGKGNKAGSLRLSTKLLEEVKQEFCGEVFLFENLKSKSKQFSRQYIFEVVSKFQIYTGRPFSPHKLRHSRATNLLKAGENLSGVSELLRHSSKSTTSRFYDHTGIDFNNLLKGEV